MLNDTFNLSKDSTHRLQDSWSVEKVPLSLKEPSLASLLIVIETNSYIRCGARGHHISRRSPLCLDSIFICQIINIFTITSSAFIDPSTKRARAQHWTLKNCQIESICVDSHHTVISEISLWCDYNL